MDNYVGGGGLSDTPVSVRPKPYIVSEINKNTIKELEKYAKNKKCEYGNLIEVMSCQGGCSGGNATLAQISTARKSVEEYSEKSFDIGEEED